MTQDTVIVVGLAKKASWLHAASMTMRPKFSKKLSRQSFFRFMAQQPPAIMMDACGKAKQFCFVPATDSSNRTLNSSTRLH